MNICAFLRLLYHPWHIFTSQIYSVASSHFSFERNSSMCYESAWKVVLGLFSQLGLCRIHDFLRAWIVYAVGYLSYVNPELPPRLYCPTSKHRGLKKTPLFPILQLDWLKKENGTDFSNRQSAIMGLREAPMGSDLSLHTITRRYVARSKAN